MDKSLKDDEQFIVKDIKKDKKITKLITLIIKQEKELKHFLEIELSCLALEIDGEKKQRQSLEQKELSFYWNGRFTESGYHNVLFIFRIISRSKSINIGDIKHRIKVNKIDHLTKHHVKLFSFITGAIGTLIGIIETLQNIGII